MRMITPSQAYRLFKPCLTAPVEEFWAAALNSEKDVLQVTCLFKGTVDSCLFHPRDVFRFACAHNASSVIVAHNHPNGRPFPSPQDVTITRQLIAAGEFMQMPIVDHLIIAKGGYFSFAEAGWLTGPDVPAAP